LYRLRNPPGVYRTEEFQNLSFFIAVVLELTQFLAMMKGIQGIFIDWVNEYNQVKMKASSFKDDQQFFFH
jgi:hypothetical protein